MTFSLDSYFAPKNYPYIKISSKALQNNLTLLQKKLPAKTKTLIPVKANAYGCGLQEIFPFLQKANIDMLGVANVNEGKFLRKIGWQKPILLLGGFFKEQAETFFEYEITPTVSDLNHFEFLNSIAKAKNSFLKIHIKWDTGMGRIGITPSQFDKATAAFKKADYLKLEGMFTHFPRADEKENSTTLNQLNKFLKTANDFLQDTKTERSQVLLHVANSYALFHFPQTHLDMVRPGLFFYGYFQNLADKLQYQEQLPLQPALQLIGKPISLRKLFYGDTVSYGSNYTVQEKELSVALLPLGYADGIPRQLAGKISFENHRLIGNVTMDQIVVENVADANEIYLLGKSSPPLEKWADINKTISYEILTKFGNRLKRVLT